LCDIAGAQSRASSGSSHRRVSRNDLAIRLDQLADQGVAVRTVEKSGGFIATETIALPIFTTDPHKWADCGTFAGFRYAPTVVDYTVFVREASTGSLMKTSARCRLTKSTGEGQTDCVSTGAFEESFDASVKQRAETTR
jgi:hypothetical protein